MQSPDAEARSEVHRSWPGGCRGRRPLSRWTAWTSSARGIPIELCPSLSKPKCPTHHGPASPQLSTPYLELGKRQRSERERRLGRAMQDLTTAELIEDKGGGWGLMNLMSLSANLCDVFINASFFPTSHFRCASIPNKSRDKGNSCCFVAQIQRGKRVADILQRPLEMFCEAV